MASSSSSTNVASPDPGTNISRYDVFLSFRGEDTRNSFTDHLYKALREAGHYTFRDNDSISRGEDLKPKIEEGIRESRASIIVLSKSYATSRWCLDELSLILEQRNVRNHYVLPIFYNVDPSHVRNQEETFHLTVKSGTKWTEDNVERWKASLKKVGNMTGKVASGPETSFIREIVDIITERLNLKHVYRQANLVGMDTRDKEINSWLEKSDSEILAIWGMGGSGKTTLARHIAYSNWQKFEHVSILEDIGSRSTDDLCQLQEKLVRDIIEGKEKTIPSVCQGTYTIEYALQRKKALIVLNNIVTRTELDALLGTGTKTQSKIIITTTYQHASKWFQSTSWRCKEHRMKLLDDSESLELLNFHAHEPKTSMEGYEDDLANKVILYCQGNPLALKVLGSSLNDDRRKDVWDSRFRSFEREIHGDIKKVLRLSYDRLPLAADRNLFLHIACYFIGKDKDYVEKVLEPDYSAISGIVTLTNCCLLSVSPNNKLMMHRLLQEMARTIVYDESPSHPGKRSRLWRDKDSHEVLCKRNGSTKVEGLALDMKMLRQERSEQGRKELSDVVISDSFKKMNSLKLLQLNQLEITGSYENILRDLRWLCWREFRLKAIPPELDMENLVAIDMSCSRLEVFQPPDVLPSLQILNLKDSDDLFEISNIYLLPKLETLILSNCRSLVRVCNTLGDLTSLVLLNITGCESLCKRDEIKASLTVGNSREQPSFLLPHSLKRLFLKDCNLEDTDYFPLNFRNQLLLEYLNVVVNPFKYLPSYTHLKNLRVLDLSGCSALKLLLRLPSNLAELYIFYCDSLERVTFESQKYTLQDFGYEGCVNLTEVEDLFKLVPVAKLAETDLGHMKWLKEYQDLEVCLVGNDQLTKGRSLYLQMLYEFNIRSISLPDIEKPNMIPEYDHTSEYPVLSFNVPCPEKRTLRGLNITFKYAMQGDEWVWFAKISTTNGVDLIYNPKVFGKPASDEVGIWLSYWPIGDSLHVGDEVNVSIVVTKGLEITGCGASLVYTEDEEENESFHDCSESFVENNEFSKDVNESFEDNNRHADILGGDNNVSIVVTKGVEIKGCGASLVYAEDEEENEIFYDCSESFVENNEFSKDVNESFKDNNRHADILGGDISGFMLSTGTYYLCRRDYLELMEVGRVTANWFRNLVGNAIDYTEIGGWRTTGRPKQPYRSYTELKTVGCIIYGSEMEDIYKIEELSKLSLVDKAVEDVNIDYSMESTSSIFSEPISKLTAAVIHVLKTTTNFKPQLKKLKTTLDRINPIIEEIHNLNHQLDQLLDRTGSQQSRMFADEIEEANKLVRKCEKVKWNPYKRFNYSLRLEDINAKLLRFFQIELQADQCRDNKQLLFDNKQLMFEMNHVTTRLSSMASDVSALRNTSMSVSSKRGRGTSERDHLGWQVPPRPPGIVAFEEPLEKLKTKVLAGIDEYIDDNNDDDDTSKVADVVLVSAAGGCGKTTLVRMLCNDTEIQDKFGDNIFYVTVSETPAFMVIVNDLFNPNFGQQVPFQSIEDAQHKLENFFRKKVSGPILLVLDDVWSESFIKHFQFQIKVRYRVVVTSRMVFPKFDVFQFDPLSDEDAKTLFCRSAEPSHSIDDNLVNQMVKCCKKHPLTLAVVGSSLKGNDASVWRHTIKLFSLGHSVLDLNEDVLVRLETSFKALEEKFKQCYLDFGLFLEDQRIPANVLLNMWVHLYNHDDEGTDTLAKLYQLSYRNLVSFMKTSDRKDVSATINYCEQQFVTQHDLLRQLAVNLNSTLPIAHRERLIISAQEDLLTTNVRGQERPSSIEKVKEPMQARILSISTGESFSSRWCDMKAPEVEVLVLNLMSKTYTLPHFLKDMQKLSIINVTNYGLYPTKFENLDYLGRLSNLTRIRLERVTISSLSRSTLALQNMQKVSFIMCNIGNAFKELSSVDLDVWPKLVEIEMDYCQDLVEFPGILCRSVYLKNLSITNCNEMCKISEEFGKLTSLETLSLRSCTKLEILPGSITCLQKLSVLDISDCLSLSELPEDMGNLGGLRTIYMKGCTGIHELPSSLQDLSYTKVVCNEEISYQW